MNLSQKSTTSKITELRAALESASRRPTRRKIVLRAGASIRVRLATYVFDCFVALSTVCSPLGNSFPVYLRYRACILYLVIRPTCGLIVWTAWTPSPSAHALRNFLVDLLPCRFHPLRTPAFRVVARDRASPSPSLCLRTLETHTSFTCSLCASARSPCKHSRITACSNKFRSFMFDYHFTCAKLQHSHAL